MEDTLQTLVEIVANMQYIRIANLLSIASTSIYFETYVSCFETFILYGGRG